MSIDSRTETQSTRTGSLAFTALMALLIDPERAKSSLRHSSYDLPRPRET